MILARMLFFLFCLLNVYEIVSTIMLKDIKFTIYFAGTSHCLITLKSSLMWHLELLQIIM